VTLAAQKRKEKLIALYRPFDYALKVKTAAFWELSELTTSLHGVISPKTIIFIYDISVNIKVTITF
jgi:hypothetical protein